MNAFTLSAKLSSLAWESLFLVMLSFQAEAGGLVVTNQIQVAPTNLIFLANTGSGIQSNPTVVVPAGSTYLLGADVYPAGTFDIYGNKVTAAKSIGVWRCTGARWLAYSFATPFPTSPAYLEDGNFTFRLNGIDGINFIYTKGPFIAANNPQLIPGQVMETTTQAVIGGTGLNSLAFGTLSVVVYPSLVANLTFSFPIVYTSGN